MTEKRLCNSITQSQLEILTAALSHELGSLNSHVKLGPNKNIFLKVGFDGAVEDDPKYQDPDLAMGMLAANVVLAMMRLVQKGYQLPPYTN